MKKASQEEITSETLL